MGQRVPLALPMWDHASAPGGAPGGRVAAQCRYQRANFFAQEQRGSTWRSSWVHLKTTWRSSWVTLMTTSGLLR